MSKPVLRPNPLPVVEGWAMDLYCKYTADVIHDIDTHGVSYGGHTRADARAQAKEAGWILHRDGTATCRRCAKALGLT
jgi:hypothetical protein